MALVWATAPQASATAPPAHAPSEDASSVEASILGENEEAPKRITVERVQAKLIFYDQYGRGYQSKAGPPEGPGSERLQVVQPAASLTIRQRNQAISHTLTTVFDVVSAASPDALDAVSQASRYNEAGTLDVTTTIDTSDRDSLSFRYGVHVEEHWRTGFGGLGYSGSFNEKNTVVSTSVNVIVDYFDDLHPRGWNDAHQPSIKAVAYLRPPQAASGGASSFDLGFSRYIRTNDLHANVLSLGYAQTF